MDNFWCFVCHRDDPGPRPDGCSSDCLADHELADTIAREGDRA